MVDSFRTLARWTGWANQRIYEACSKLNSDEYFRTRACAFGSIHRTLNHLLATDRIWLARLAGETHNIPSLDYEVCPDFTSLRAARLVEDRRIVTIIDTVLDGGDAGRDVAFNSMDRTPRRMPTPLVLSQLFLHHAHHRGQVHALLSQTSVAPPALDLTYFPERRDD